MALGWAVGEQILDRNPVIGIKPLTSEASLRRDRVLDEAEIRASVACPTRLRLWRYRPTTPADRPAPRGSRRHAVERAGPRQGACGPCPARGRRTSGRISCRCPSRRWTSCSRREAAASGRDLRLRHPWRPVARLGRRARLRSTGRGRYRTWGLHDLRRRPSPIWPRWASPPHVIEAIVNHASGVTRLAWPASTTGPSTCPSARPRWSGGRSASWRSSRPRSAPATWCHLTD